MSNEIINPEKLDKLLKVLSSAFVQNQKETLKAVLAFAETRINGTEYQIQIHLEPDIERWVLPNRIEIREEIDEVERPDSIPGIFPIDRDKYVN